MQDRQDRKDKGKMALEHFSNRVRDPYTYTAMSSSETSSEIQSYEYRKSWSTIEEKIFA